MTTMPTMQMTRFLAAAALTLTASACGKKVEQAPPPPPPVKVAPDAAAVVPPTEATAAAGAGAFKEVTGFATPESVLVVAGQDYYLVANINGGPLDADDNGFISKVGVDGTMLELKWIDGGSDKVTLSAPKGMAIFGGKLYVADITAVRVFDAATGAPAGDLAIEGASFLNDVAAGDDGVYVSDTGVDGTFKGNGKHAVYKLDAAGKVTKFVAGDGFEAPNGVLVNDGQVWVASFGSKDFYRVDGGKKVDVQTMPTGGLDGLDHLGDGRLVVSSWEGKAVYVGTPGALFTALISDVESPADIAVDRQRKRILVPTFGGNTLRLYDYK